MLDGDWEYSEQYEISETVGGDSGEDTTPDDGLSATKDIYYCTFCDCKLIKCHLADHVDSSEHKKNMEEFSPSAVARRSNLAATYMKKTSVKDYTSNDDHPKTYYGNLRRRTVVIKKKLVRKRKRSSYGDWYDDGAADDEDDCPRYYR